MLKNKIILHSKSIVISAFLILSLLSNSRSMVDYEDFDEEKNYKIKNVNSGHYLNGWGVATGIGTATMAMDDQNETAVHRLWRFQRYPEYPGYYKIKNVFSGNCLNGWGVATGIGTATMAIDAQDETANHRLWRCERQLNGSYKIKHFYSGNCLNGWGKETGRGTATMAIDAQNETANHRLWKIEADIT